MSMSRKKIVHGTVNTYKRHGCRCNECRDARRQEQKRLRSSPEVKARAVERAQGYQRGYHLMKQYGMTVEEYDVMVTRQDGRCAICNGCPQRLHIDHNHKTGKVRGLLCGNCNMGLGQFEDDTDRLLDALTYLQGGGNNENL